MLEEISVFRVKVDKVPGRLLIQNRLQSRFAFFIHSPADKLYQWATLDVEALSTTHEK